LISIWIGREIKTNLKRRFDMSKTLKERYLAGEEIIQSRISMAST
jgi:hypothetical protein